MRTISKEELEQILKKHKEWLRHGEIDELGEMRADLRNTDLRGVDLSNVDLSGAILWNVNLSDTKLIKTNLYGADLSGSNLIGADLSRADLSRANLRHVSLVGAELVDADLFEADLYEANLREATLSRAYLRAASLVGANLRHVSLVGAELLKANLRGANLRGADLEFANLSEVELFGANLFKANLRRATLPDLGIMNAICPLTCPETGAFIGWKKADAMISDEAGHPRIISVIVKLQIPARAKRSSATSRKCRCDKAAVLDIQTLDGKSLSKGTVANSKYYPTFTYQVGQKIHVKDFDDDRWNECSTGIHFFITRQEAVDY